MADNKPTSVNWASLRDTLAVLIAIIVGFIGIFGMINGELAIVVDSATNMLSGLAPEPSDSPMMQGLMKYLSAAGLVFFLSGIGYILLGYKDQTWSDPTQPNDWK